MPRLFAYNCVMFMSSSVICLDTVISFILDMLLAFLIGFHYLQINHELGPTHDAARNVTFPTATTSNSNRNSRTPHTTSTTAAANITGRKIQTMEQTPKQTILPSTSIRHPQRPRHGTLGPPKGVTSPRTCAKDIGRSWRHVVETILCR